MEIGFTIFDSFVENLGFISDVAAIYNLASEVAKNFYFIRN
jgi:hypothetical protein